MKRLPTAEEEGRCLCGFFVSLDVRLATIKKMDGCLSAVATCSQLVCPVEIR